MASPGLGRGRREAPQAPSGGGKPAQPPGVLLPQPDGPS
jgi:hypothetical protein